MTGFSADWLSLREAADVRARNPDLAAQVARHFASTGPVRIVDLGAGTGANLRASAALFGDAQHWTLLDHAPDLIAASRERLAAWADAAENVPDGMHLEKDGRRITVAFVLTDLARSLAAVELAMPHLITASAFFDLVSRRFIEELADTTDRLGAAFYTVITCDGDDVWTPAHPLDAAVAAGFAADQGRDKGFGPALGHGASAALVAAFRHIGYRCVEGPSPWHLEAADRALIDALAAGTASAVAGHVEAGALAEWRRARTHATCRIGHRDVLALPREEA